MNVGRCWWFSNSYHTVTVFMIEISIGTDIAVRHRHLSLCSDVLAHMTFQRTVARCYFQACTPTLNWNKACGMNMIQVGWFPHWFQIMLRLLVEFLPRNAMLAWYMLSLYVCPSICLSVTSLCSTRRVKSRIMHTMPGTGLLLPKMLAKLLLVTPNGGQIEVG